MKTIKMIIPIIIKITNIIMIITIKVNSSTEPAYLRNYETVP